MPKAKSWKFPRWSGYEKSRDPARVRLCDRDGCGRRGDNPAPKSRYSDDKWWFCQEHAAEYNRNWNYFAGMTDRDTADAEAQDEGVRNAYQKASSGWRWDAFGGSRGQREHREALAVLGLDQDAEQNDIKRRFRELAKENHPDRNQGSKDAEDRFKRICAAYDVLAAKNRR